jgi:hypothetical protein
MVVVGDVTMLESLNDDDDDDDNDDDDVIVLEDDSIDVVVCDAVDCVENVGGNVNVIRPIVVVPIAVDVMSVIVCFA